MTFPSLNTAGPLDPARFGGKSAHLAGLATQGFPIPSGFAIPVETVLDWQAPLLPQIEAEIATLGARGEEEVSGRILSLFLSHDLGSALRAKLVAAATAHLPNGLRTPVAVRSSAVGEDAAEASFAGQFESLLGVLGLDAMDKAIRRVWASLYSPRAILYRHKAGLPAAASPMGVTVLEMVDATASGVAFSVDVVSGKRDRLVIEATHGLAEPLVQGQITPDRYVIDKAERRLMTAGLGDKAWLCQTLPGGHGAPIGPMPGPMQSRFSLSPAEAEEIAGHLLRLETAMGYPVDIEWALGGTRALSLLQVRPISSALPEAPLLHWDPALCLGPA